MLTIQGLNTYYGAIHALKDVAIEVKEGEIVSIIGSNGAGKSTLLRTISGLIPARSGTVRFQGEEIQSTTADAIVKMGISHSPEGRRIFTNMTVHENLLLGAFIRDDNEISSDMEAVLDRFPRMRERFKQNAGTLSGGEQQMLAIGRALMSRPKLLLLDEPSLGLAPNLVAEIFRIILDINSTGTTILVVEQNAHRALEIAHRAYVLETGAVVLSDSGKALLTNPKVRESYLGG
ncbi:MAG: ABC transporter ATP-binding protein [Chthonomonas sp.]|nr:ABC transporter ATP-binding protein [Chthonomonas sp.]